MRLLHHHDRRRYFDVQLKVTRESFIPFIESSFLLPQKARILEIGCGEGAVLKGFSDKGYTAIGVEQNDEQVKNGLSWLKEEVEKGSIRFITGNIFNISVTQLDGTFHLIVVRDVIKDVHDRGLLLWMLKKILHPGGAIFFAFSSRRLPSSDNQEKQHKENQDIQPWMQLLPRPHKYIPELPGNFPVNEFREVNNSRITIDVFEQLAKAGGYRVIARKYYWISPFYKYRFRLKPREQPSFLQKIPYLRNLLAASVYYIIRPEGHFRP